VEFASIFTSFGERKFRLGSVSANENMPSELDSPSLHGVWELSERSAARKRAKARASRMCPNKRISKCDPMVGGVCRLSAPRHTGCTRVLELSREHKPSPSGTSAGSHHRHSIEVLVERAARRLAVERSSGRFSEMFQVKHRLWRCCHNRHARRSPIRIEPTDNPTTYGAALKSQPSTRPTHGEPEVIDCPSVHISVQRGRPPRAGIA
jgi:hypothetical protein